MKKYCTICGVDKEIDSNNFPKDKRRKDGYCNQCRSCVRRRDAERYNQKRSEILNSRKQYYQKNKEARKKYQNSYYYANQDKCRQSQKEWQKSNPTNRRMINGKSRTNQYGSASTLTQEEWLAIKECFGCCCAYCGMTEGDHLKEYDEMLHQEHLVPLAIHGPYSIGNIVPSCRSCNSSKANHDFFEWYPKSKGYNQFREIRIINYIRQYQIKELIT